MRPWNFVCLPENLKKFKCLSMARLNRTKILLPHIKEWSFLFWQEIVMDCFKKNGCSHQQYLSCLVILFWRGLLLRCMQHWWEFWRYYSFIFLESNGCDRNIWWRPRKCASNSGWGPSFRKYFLWWAGKLCCTKWWGMLVQYFYF